jgi:hypothetical protein
VGDRPRHLQRVEHAHPDDRHASSNSNAAVSFAAGTKRVLLSATDAYLATLATIADSATVSTAQATASTTYVDLTTAGPSVTLTTGASVLVTISGRATKAAGGIGNDGFLALDVSGATTIAAADANAASLSYPLASGGFNFQLSRTFKVTGLTPGSNTFKLKYRCNGGNAWTFSDRDITVIAL